ncbi:MAG TPA: DinB family protein [Caulifigura sp.]|nr:DinB family protein [Caulifigura sp.]
MDQEKLIRDYTDVVVQLKESVAGLSDQQRRSHPVPGKWSVHEVVCHIADFEPISTDRICRVIALDRPSLLGADETEFAKALAYDARDFDEQMQLIEVLRSHTARILRTLPAAAFARVGVHNEAGPLTLEQLLVRVTTHLPHHIAFIWEKRKALGV